jgi:hypothetical protein
MHEFLLQVLTSLFSLTAAAVGFVVLAFRFRHGAWAVIAAAGCLLVIGADILTILFGAAALPLLDRIFGNLADATITTVYFVIVDLGLATGVGLLVLGVCLGRRPAAPRITR